MKELPDAFAAEIEGLEILDSQTERHMVYSSQWWRLNNLYYIKDKDGKKGILRFNKAQVDFFNKMGFFNALLKARQLGFCVHPDTRVLTADLRWIRIEDLRVGNEIIAVDENIPSGRGKARKMRTAIVQRTIEVYHKSYEIRLDDGRKLICTGKHPWLCRTTASTDTKWMNIEGSEGKPTIKVGTKIRWITKPWDASAFEDGWFGGILDGEGSMAKSNSAASINVSQREGRVWDRINSYLTDRGYNYCIESDKAERLNKYGKVPVPKAVVGRMNEMFKLIGQTRPSRFLSNRFWEGRELPGKRNGGIGWASVVSIKELPKQRLIDLQTSTGTYIAEGFVSHNTTEIMIYFLDCCLFNDNQAAGVVAHTKEDAQDLFDNKVKFAYDNLPEWLKHDIPANIDTAKKMVFGNGSSFAVGTSLRSGTYQKLLVSEYGKLSAKYPEKAREIKTGALNTVALGQQIFVESTAEGKAGEFYDLVATARALQAEGKKLTRLDPKFHFYAWFWDEGYRLTDEETARTVISKEMAEYLAPFNLDANQKAWYAAKAAVMKDDMRREFPSTPDEAFEGSLEGAFYTQEMQEVRRSRGICRLPYDRGYPVTTFWDLGGSRDQFSIGFYQYIDRQHRFIDYHESNGEGWNFYAKLLNDKPYVYDRHYFPHDGRARRVGLEVFTAQEMAEQVGIRPIEIVPVTKSVYDDIRNFCKPFLPQCLFDEVNCALLISRLDSYRRRWDDVNSMWMNEALHDEASHGADMVRTAAVALKDNRIMESYKADRYAITGQYDHGNNRPGSGPNAWMAR